MSRAKHVAASAAVKWMSMSCRSASWSSRSSGSWLFKRKPSPKEERIAELERLLFPNKPGEERFAKTIVIISTVVRCVNFTVGVGAAGVIAYAEFHHHQWKKKQAEKADRV